MAQAMRGRARINPPCSIRHDRAPASRGEMVMGSTHRHEYGPAVLGAGLFQIFGQPETDVLQRGIRSIQFPIPRTAIVPAHQSISSSKALRPRRVVVAGSAGSEWRLRQPTGYLHG